MEKFETKIIPAQSGYFLCVGVPENTIEPITELFREPIIAWAIIVIPSKRLECPDVIIYPITLNGYDKDASYILIQKPNGNFEFKMNAIIVRMRTKRSNI